MKQSTSSVLLASANSASNYSSSRSYHRESGDSSIVGKSLKVSILHMIDISFTPLVCHTLHPLGNIVGKVKDDPDISHMATNVKYHAVR